MFLSGGQLLNAVRGGNGQPIEVFVTVDMNKAGDLAGSSLAGLRVRGADLIADPTSSMSLVVPSAMRTSVPARSSCSRTASSTSTSCRCCGRFPGLP